MSLAALVLFSRTATSIADSLLGPWFAVCEWVTPASVQTKGNMLLGLLWVVSGIVLYCAIFGSACAAFLAGVEKLTGRGARR